MGLDVGLRVGRGVGRFVGLGLGRLEGLGDCAGKKSICRSSFSSSSSSGLRVGVLVGRLLGNSSGSVSGSTSQNLEFSLHRWPGQHVCGLFLFLEPHSHERSDAMAHLAALVGLRLGRNEGKGVRLRDGPSGAKILLLEEVGWDVRGAAVAGASVEETSGSKSIREGVGAGGGFGPPVEGSVLAAELVLSMPGART